MTTIKPKGLRGRIFSQLDPISIAAGNLSKSLERFGWINYDIRKGLVEEMKNLPYLTHLNMPMLASTLVLYESVPSVAVSTGIIGQSDKGQDLLSFFQQVEARVPSGVTVTVTGIDLSPQELYDEITRPLLEDLEENLSREQINDILLRVKASLFRYSVRLHQYRSGI